MFLYGTGSTCSVVLGREDVITHNSRIAVVTKYSLHPLPMQHGMQRQRQEAQWKLAQACRMQAEAEQLEAQLYLLGLQDETKGVRDREDVGERGGARKRIC